MISTNTGERNSSTQPTISSCSSQPCKGRGLTADALVLPDFSQLACVASGMCSLSKVKPYVGDITPGE